MNMNGDQGLSSFLNVNLFLTQSYWMTLEDLKYSSQLLWTNCYGTFMVLFAIIGALQPLIIVHFHCTKKKNIFVISERNDLLLITESKRFG